MGESDYQFIATGTKHGKLHVTIEPRIVADFSFCSVPILSHGDTIVVLNTANSNTNNHSSHLSGQELRGLVRQELRGLARLELDVVWEEEEARTGRRTGEARS